MDSIKLSPTHFAIKKKKKFTATQKKEYRLQNYKFRIIHFVLILILIFFCASLKCKVIILSKAIIVLFINQVLLFYTLNLYYSS